MKKPKPTKYSKSGPFKKNVKYIKKEPVAKAGNYAAPVDTVGMDESMKVTLGIGGKKRFSGGKFRKEKK
jgi:hypothetical protein